MMLTEHLRKMTDSLLFLMLVRGRFRAYITTENSKVSEVGAALRCSGKHCCLNSWKVVGSNPTLSLSLWSLPVLSVPAWVMGVYFNCRFFFYSFFDDGSLSDGKDRMNYSIFEQRYAIWDTRNVSVPQQRPQR